MCRTRNSAECLGNLRFFKGTVSNASELEIDGANER